jgi:hypothetical protein
MKSFSVRDNTWDVLICGQAKWRHLVVPFYHIYLFCSIDTHEDNEEEQQQQPLQCLKHEFEGWSVSRDPI